MGCRVFGVLSTLVSQRLLLKDSVLNDLGGCWEIRDRFSETKMLQLNRHVLLSMDG